MAKSASHLPQSIRSIEAQHRSLLNQRASGTISTEAFLAALDQLSIRDSQGRHWRLGEEPGVWYVWNGVQWMISQHSPSLDTKPPKSTATRWIARLSVFSIGAIVIMAVLCVFGIIAALLLTGGGQDGDLLPVWVQGASPSSRMPTLYLLSAQQQTLRAELGEPEAFSIMFYEEEDVGFLPADMRFEEWYYFNHGKAYIFLNGELIGEDTLMVALASYIPVPYVPEQFSAYLSLEEMVFVAGLDNFIEVPLENVLIPGGKVYFADQLTFGMQDGELRYVEAVVLYEED